MNNLRKPPKEKAKELYNKCFIRYCHELSHDKNYTKAIAIADFITDEQIGNVRRINFELPKTKYINILYWKDVKLELKLLQP